MISSHFIRSVYYEHDKILRVCVTKYTLCLKKYESAWQNIRVCIEKSTSLCYEIYEYGRQYIPVCVTKYTSLSDKWHESAWQTSQSDTTIDDKLYQSSSWQMIRVCVTDKFGRQLHLICLFMLEIIISALWLSPYLLPK